MRLNEAAGLLGYTREETLALIKDGVRLKGLDEPLRLAATPTGTGHEHEISDADLDALLAEWDKREPGRHPPVAVRRELLVEANHRCAICRQLTPIEYHHMLDFAKKPHHDPRHMLALCPNDHAYCTKGLYDQKAQRMYKQRLQKGEDRSGVVVVAPLRVEWGDLREMIGSLAEVVGFTQDGSDAGAPDFSYVNIEKKNELNRLGTAYFQVIRERHEPYFGRIAEFLKNPANAEATPAYEGIVAEMRVRLAARQGDGATPEMDAVLLALYEEAQDSGHPIFRAEKPLLLVLLSFMYANCDIGRKA